MLFSRSGFIAGSPPPQDPSSFDSLTYLLDATTGYSMSEAQQFDYRIYAVKFGSLSNGYVSPGTTYYDQNMYGVDIPYGNVSNSGQFSGNTSFSYQIQTHLFDGSTYGYSPIWSQGSDVNTTPYLAVDSLGEDYGTGGSYQSGDSIDYKVWVYWDDGVSNKIGEGSADFNYVVSNTGFDVQFSIATDSVFGIAQSPDGFYIQRNLNGGGWEEKYVAINILVNDDGNGWGAVTTPDTVRYDVGMYMFGSFPAGISIVDYIVERLDNNTSQYYYHSSLSDTLGHGWVDIGFSSGNATFQSASYYQASLGWSASPTSGATYRIFSLFYNYDNPGNPRNDTEYTAYKNTGLTSAGDDGTGWTYP